LLKTLKKSGTTHQIILLLANENSLAKELVSTLNNAFDKVISVDALITEQSSKYDVLVQRPELAVTYTKLHAFRLTEFDACCFLDADTMVVENIDDILNKNTCFAACPEFSWPDSFNSGVFTFKPNLETYDTLMKLASEQNSSYDGGDQGLLNNHFKNNWKRMSVLYNMPVQNFGKLSMKPENYGFSPAFMQFGGNTKVVHFLGGGGNKPWNFGGSSDGTIQGFKTMWENNVREALEEYAEKDILQDNRVIQDSGSFLNNNEQNQEPQVTSNQQKAETGLSFDDIWSHISSQF